MVKYCESLETGNETETKTGTKFIAKRPCCGYVVTLSILETLIA